MAGRKKRRSTKTGLPPGSLVHLGERKLDHARLTLVAYGPEGFAEQAFESPADCAGCASKYPNKWLNVYGLHEPEILAQLGRQFNLHPLVLEDILNTDQRPKVDEYDDYLFVVARFFDYDEKTATVVSEQVSLIIGRDFLLTFQEQPTGNFGPVRDRLRQEKGLIRRSGLDYLAYALLDAIVDRYFAVLESLGDRAEKLEEQLITHPNGEVLTTLHHLRREATALRRAVWPLREVINNLTRNTEFFGASVEPYMRDIYDHTVHIIESLEAIRDLIAGLLDIYLSTVSNRVNQEVRGLTVLALVFLPSTLLAGVFGMNFRNMPLLDQPDGFWLIIGAMASVATVLAVIFWRRRWLG